MDSGEAREGGRDTEDRCPFNSIEWIHDKQFDAVRAVRGRAAFNSIEWIQELDVWLAMRMTEKIFQFH